MKTKFPRLLTVLAFRYALSAPPQQNSSAPISTGQSGWNHVKYLTGDKGAGG